MYLCMCVRVCECVRACVRLLTFTSLRHPVEAEDDFNTSKKTFMKLFQATVKEGHQEA